jgi:hypothetical protein
MEYLSRRRFLKISATTFGEGAVGVQIPATPSLAMSYLRTVGADRFVLCP